MGEVINWKPRLVEGGVKNSKGETLISNGLVLACHCGSTLCELLDPGVVICSRCGCKAPIVWNWDETKTQ